MPNTGDNPISEYISYDNFGWSLLTSLQLVTMDYWESIYNSVSKRFVRWSGSSSRFGRRNNLVDCALIGTRGAINALLLFNYLISR